MPRGPAPRERFPIGEGDEEKSFEHQGRRRTYIVHVPPGLDRSRPVPLVLVLHGGVVNAYFTAHNTGMNAVADREGFIAVYPNGTGRFEDRILTWNVGFGFAYALRNNIDDVGFLRELTGRMIAGYGVDAGSVYATGISNGGIMSYRLASEASDVFAAVAPVPQKWTSPSGNITRRCYSGGRENSEVVLYAIRDGGHTWPGAVPLDRTGAGVPGAAPPGRMTRRMQSRFAARIGQPNQEISANELMWEFFKRHRRD